MLLSRMQKEEISVTLGLWWSRTLFISQSLSLHYLSIHRISSAPRQFFESLGDCNTTLSVKPLYHHHRHVHREAIALTRTTTTTMRPAMGVVLFALLAHASNTTRTPQHHHHLTHNRSRQDEEDIDQVIYTTDTFAKQTNSFVRERKKTTQDSINQLCKYFPPTAPRVVEQARLLSSISLKKVFSSAIFLFIYGAIPPPRNWILRWCMVVVRKWALYTFPTSASTGSHTHHWR